MYSFFVDGQTNEHDHKTLAPLFLWVLYFNGETPQTPFQKKYG